METVTVSSKYQVVIPTSVRRDMGIKPGQRVHVLVYDDSIVLIPHRDIRSMRGFVPGIDTAVEREGDRV